MTRFTGISISIINDRIPVLGIIHVCRTRFPFTTRTNKSTGQSCCSLCSLFSLIPFVALHLRPSISGERRAVRSRKVGVLSDVCTRSLAIVSRERRTIIRVFDMQIGSLTVRSGRSLDSLISFGALRSFQLHPLV